MASRVLARSFRNLISKNNLVQQSTLKVNKFVPLNCLNVNSKSFSASAVSMQQSNVYKDLSSFLSQEIKLENETRKYKTDLPKVTGFGMKTEGPNVTLTKQHNDEQITVKFNVNHSLDSGEPSIDEQLEQQQQQTQEKEAEMKSRPSFSVEIQRGGQTLAFGCSYLPAEEGNKDAVEDFQIDEFAIHTGEWNENVYTADCSVLDGQLYDMLLSLLDERGIGEKFANEVAEFSTAYEHSQYVSLLEKLKDFTK